MQDKKQISPILFILFILFAFRGCDAGPYSTGKTHGWREDSSERLQQLAVHTTEVTAAKTNDNIPWSDLCG